MIDPDDSSATSRTDWLQAAIVAAFAVLAWWPLLAGRPTVLDDVYNASLFKHGVAGYWQHYGIWRIVGHGLPFLVHAPADRWLALVTHLVASLLLLRVARGLGGAPVSALAAASVFAALPFGFQALTWNSALSFALSTVFAFGALLGVLRPIPDVRSGLRSGLLAGVCAFASLASNEATLLLVAWIALVPIVCKSSAISACGRMVAAGLIIASEAVWLALHLATKPEHFQKNPTFHAPALVSGLARQIEQLTYLTSLPRLGPWLAPGAWISALAAMALAILVSSRLRPIRSQAHRRLTTAFVALLPFAAVSIYALAGGFSTDARKAYVIWAFLLVVVAYFGSMLPPRSERLLAVSLIMACPVLVLSSQATVQAWNDTAERFSRAYVRIRAEQLNGPFEFEWSPNIYKAWPGFDRVCGGRFDSQASIDLSGARTAIRSDGGSTRFVWDAAAGDWIVTVR